MQKMKFKGNLLITDPCYVEDSFVHPLTSRDTIYGDWTCMVYPGKWGDNVKYKEWDKKYFDFLYRYNSSVSEEEKKKLLGEFEEFRLQWSKNILGEFCADSGQVAIFNYDSISDETRKWFDERPHCATILKDFDGTVSIEVIEESVHVIGTGNYSFFSVQSGL